MKINWTRSPRRALLVAQVSGVAMSHVRIFDTTLRDGEQSPGFSMNTEEKIRMARQLAALGVDVIEAGFPIASRGDLEAVQAVAKEVRDVPIAALARARKDDILAAVEALKPAKSPRMHVFLATSDLHLQAKLHLTRASLIIEPMASRACSRVRCSLACRCRSEVARNTCMRGDFAGFSASTAARMSSLRARASAAMGTSRTSFATACTASRSPREAIGKPASMTSTPRAASCRAIRIFSSVFMEKPGDCSPSRRVVSKIRTWLIATPET